MFDSFAKNPELFISNYYRNNAEENTRTKTKANITDTDGYVKNELIHKTLSNGPTRYITYTHSIEKYLKSNSTNTVTIGYYSPEWKNPDKSDKKIYLYRKDWKLSVELNMSKPLWIDISKDFELKKETNIARKAKIVEERIADLISQYNEEKNPQKKTKRKEEKKKTVEKTKLKKQPDKKYLKK